MPMGNVDPKDYGVMLPGHRVECLRRGRATVLVPSEVDLAGQTFDGDDVVFVRWDRNGAETWAKKNDLRFVNG